MRVYYHGVKCHGKSYLSNNSCGFYKLTSFAVSAHPFFIIIFQEETNLERVDLLNKKWKKIMFFIVTLCISYLCGLSRHDICLEIILS